MRGRGSARRVRAWAGHRLRVLRDDLWTARADPLPPSVWLRWVPHGAVCLAALGVLIGDTAQLGEHGGLDGGTAFLFALAEAGAMVLALRRPVPAWWLSLGAMALAARLVRGSTADGTLFTWPWTAAGLIAHLFVLLLLALRVPARAALEALALTVLVTWFYTGVLATGAHQPTGALSVALSAVVVALATALRGRREARSALARQTTLTAEERARRTLLEERGRIARELHDVVAHHMSVISIQAQVAPHLVTDPPEELRENLEGIRRNAVEALTELRRVLGVLRSEETGAAGDPLAPGGGGRGTTAGTAGPHAPQPTLDRLDALLENVRAAGLDVTSTTAGERRPLPPGVELSAYRIVQEALSNTLRHAPGATARLHLAYRRDGLEVEVANTRAARRPAPTPGAGHGLLGMRERVAMLGGRMTAGPRADGGYGVTVFLPGTGAYEGEA
ncbi:histidine kinase [Streptomyces sp. NPDC052077]|uniref:sensor histidine kinase n=1 Tax=Streptomyces sp. NPDC052077 TaxID=3154757 RepID=UPI00342FEE65